MESQALALQSCFYEGQVYHQRTQPKRHEFRYRVAMAYINLSQLDQFLSQTPLWSRNAMSPARFKREDYFGDPSKELDDEIKKRVKEELGFTPSGDVCLLTNLRYFGYVMNPLSTYYCFDRSGSLVAIVAEVNNTPWGEKHNYVIPADSEATRKHRFEKVFTVSPFNAVNMQYQWQSSVPAEDLGVSITARQQGHTVVHAQLSLERKEASSRAMNAFLLRYPFHTIKVISSIYFEALRLFLKGVPFLGKNYIADDKSLEH
jgi:DUF1365 family protein